MSAEERHRAYGHAGIISIQLTALKSMATAWITSAAKRYILLPPGTLPPGYDTRRCSS